MLDSLLLQKRDDIVDAWFEFVIDTYPEDGGKFFKKQKDQFANPVGSTIRVEISVLYDELIGEADPDRLSESLDKIIKIRAVQEFSPSKAISFVLALKGIVGEILGEDIVQHDCADQFQKFKSSIDNLMLRAFDLYMDCRSRIHQIRLDEVRRRSDRLFERINEAPGNLHMITDTEDISD